MQMTENLSKLSFSILYIWMQVKVIWDFDFRFQGRCAKMLSDLPLGETGIGC